MQRYFASIIDKNVVLTKDDVFHLTKVMRAKVGTKIEVVDEKHNAFIAIVKTINPISIVLQEPILTSSELKTPVTLFFGLAKSDKVEFIIQKATELGAKRIVLFQGKRSVVKFSNEDFNRKLPRFISIAKEAAEQCHREYIPEIKYVKSISDIKGDLCELNLFAYELDAGETSSFADLLDERHDSISIIIGPEGGFDSSEADELNEMGFKNVSLGKRILRCETAAVYALSVIAFHLEK